MKVLYVRNVPEEVGERLQLLADAAGMSVSAFALRELAEVARRADNPALLAALPDLHVPSERIIAEVDHMRRDR